MTSVSFGIQYYRSFLFCRETYQQETCLCQSGECGKGNGNSGENDLYALIFLPCILIAFAVPIVCIRCRFKQRDGSSGEVAGISPSKRRSPFTLTSGHHNSGAGSSGGGGCGGGGGGGGCGGGGGF